MLPGERVLLTYGHRLPGEGIRGIVSTDGGVSFPRERELVLRDDTTSHDCGYPSSVLLGDGRILTVYYAIGSNEHADWGTHCGAVAYRLPDWRQ